MLGKYKILRKMKLLTILLLWGVVFSAAQDKRGVFLGRGASRYSCSYLIKNGYTRQTCSIIIQTRDCDVSDGEVRNAL